MSTIIPIPLLVLGFLVLVGTIAGVSWLHVRRGPRLSLDNASVATKPWFRIPYLDAFFELPRKLPGMYRPVGTWIAGLLILVVGACFVWAASATGLLLAVISSYYAEQAMERALIQYKVPGLVMSVTLLIVGILMAVLHFALLMQKYLL